MKTIIVITLLIIPFLSFSQLTINESKTNYFVAGFNTGYSFKANKPTAGISVGYRFNDAYLSANSLIALTSNRTTPKVFNFNAGYNIGSVQPFLSASYQTIGSEAEQFFKNTPERFINGWRLGYGLSYYFNTMPIALTAARYGKESNLSLSVYRAL